MQPPHLQFDWVVWITDFHPATLILLNFSTRSYFDIFSGHATCIYSLLRCSFHGIFAQPARMARSSAKISSISSALCLCAVHECVLPFLSSTTNLQIPIELSSIRLASLQLRTAVQCSWNENEAHDAADNNNKQAQRQANALQIGAMSRAFNIPPLHDYFERN